MRSCYLYSFFEARCSEQAGKKFKAVLYKVKNLKGEVEVKSEFY